MRNLITWTLLLALCSATSSVFAEEKNAEWRTVTFKEGGEFLKRCGWLMPGTPTEPKKPRELKDLELEYKTVMTTKGIFVKGWLLPKIPSDTVGVCPHCGTGNHGNPQGNASVAVNGVPGMATPLVVQQPYQGQATTAQANAAYSPQVAYAQGVGEGYYYQPKPTPPQDNGYVVVNGVAYPRAASNTTNVNVLQTQDNPARMTFSGGVRGGVEPYVNFTDGRVTIVTGDVNVNVKKDIHNTTNTTNTTTIVNLPPPPPQLDYCGHTSAQGHVWCSQRRVWFRNRSAWMAGNCRSNSMMGGVGVLGPGFASSFGH